MHIYRPNCRTCTPEQLPCTSMNRGCIVRYIAVHSSCITKPYICVLSMVQPCQTALEPLSWMLPAPFGVCTLEAAFIDDIWIQLSSLLRYHSICFALVLLCCLLVFYATRSLILELGSRKLQICILHNFLVVSCRRIQYCSGSTGFRGSREESAGQASLTYRTVPNQ